MAELIKINENSGIWRIKPSRRKKPLDKIACFLETVGYYGNARGHYEGSYLEGDITFKVDKRNYHHTEILSSEGVNLGVLDWGIDVFKNINWSLGPIVCSLKGFQPCQITKRYDSLRDPNCNMYYDFVDNKDRKIATTTFDFHSFFKLKELPPKFNVISRENDDPNPWLIALLTMYIHSIDGRFQAKPM